MTKRFALAGCCVLCLILTGCYNDPNVSLKKPGEGPARIMGGPAVGPGTTAGGSTAGPQPVHPEKASQHDKASPHEKQTKESKPEHTEKH